MGIKNLTRLFKTGSAKTKTSLYLHDPIIEALEKIKAKTGDSVSDLVAEALDDYLTNLVELGLLEPPNGAKPTEPNLTLAKTGKAEGA